MEFAESSGRRNFQVGGSGEGNLPKTSYTLLSENETFNFISALLRNAGDFSSSNTRLVVKQAVEELALPYVP